MFSLVYYSEGSFPGSGTHKYYSHLRGSHGNEMIEKNKERKYYKKKFKYIS